MAGHTFDQRLDRLRSWPQLAGRRNSTPPLGSCATMLFLGTRPDLRLSEQTAAKLVQLAQRPPIRQALQAGPHKDAVRQLAAKFLTHCANDSQGVLEQRIKVIFACDLPEALPLAAAVAYDDSDYLTVNPSVRAHAILAVAKYGGPEHVDGLAALLEDESVCAKVARPSGHNSIQIRDVALAGLLHLTDQDLKEYGFPKPRTNNRTLFVLATLIIPGDEQRAAAIAKWKEWHADQEAVSETDVGLDD